MQLLSIGGTLWAEAVIGSSLAFGSSNLSSNLSHHLDQNNNKSDCPSLVDCNNRLHSLDDQVAPVAEALSEDLEFSPLNIVATHDALDHDSGSEANNFLSSWLLPEQMVGTSSPEDGITTVPIVNNDAGYSVDDAFVEGSHLWSLLVAGYCVVFTVGVIGNAILLAALCGSGSRARALPVRNHLMVNLAAADLLVTAICVPISACAAASHACWPGFMVSWMCQLGPLLQRTPVAASTLSLALLSLDRWAAIRHPRFAQRFRERRFVAMSMVSIWILASLVAVPTFWARQWDENPQSYWAEAQNSEPIEQESTELPTTSESTTTNSSNWEQWEWSGVCVERWTNAGIQLAYAATYLGTAFVSPALIVAACHASVSQKLTAQLQGLTGTGGDPKRQRPKQVIIVARDLGMNNPNGAGERLNGGHGPTTGTRFMENPRPSRKLVPCDPNSDEDDVYLRMQIQADLESFRQLSQMQQSHANVTRGMRSYPPRGAPPESPPGSNNSISTPKKTANALRAARRETSIIRAHRRLRKKLAGAATLNPPPLLPTYSSQSFRSRRRAANLLAALAGVFVLCWAPYVVCALSEMFVKEKTWIRLLIPFSLFLGHAHSALNPIVSWRLNRSAFVRFQRQPTIWSCLPDWSWIRGCRVLTTPCCYCCESACCQQTSHLARTNTRHPHGASANVHQLSSLPPTRNGHHNQPKCRCCRCGSGSSGPCCYCPMGIFIGRRSSSPDMWARNTSTNEAALGAFHPKYLNRMPAPDPVSKCHTSHFLK